LPEFHRLLPLHADPQAYFKDVLRQTAFICFVGFVVGSSIYHLSYSVE